MGYSVARPVSGRPAQGHGGPGRGTGGHGLGMSRADGFYSCGEHEFDR